MTTTELLDAFLSYAGLVALATTSVYAGSLGSYKPPKSAHPTAGEDESDDEELAERLSSSEAVLFPIIGSIVLGGFYLAFKYFGEDWINKLLGYYFCIMGVGCVWSCLISITKTLLGPTRYRSTPRFQIGSTGKPLVSFRLSTVLLFPLAAVPSITFFMNEPKSALMTDVLALSFSHAALSMMKLDSLQTGCILLGGLFFYDIWWVFGTTVMVTVATTLTIPIKLLWPRSILTALSLLPTPPDYKPTMLLGLGDVVIPGTLVALAHRLDMHLSRKNKTDSDSYFRATLVGYAVGLSMAFAAMHIFRAAQPALLYLSPSCCLTFIFTALKRGEWSYVWNWEDGAEEEKERKEREKKEKETKAD